MNSCDIALLLPFPIKMIKEHFGVFSCTTYPDIPIEQSEYCTRDSPIYHFRFQKTHVLSSFLWSPGFHRKGYGNVPHTAQQGRIEGDLFICFIQREHQSYLFYVFKLCVRYYVMLHSILKIGGWRALSLTNPENYRPWYL